MMGILIAIAFPLIVVLAMIYILTIYPATAQLERNMRTRASGYQLCYFCAYGLDTHGTFAKCYNPELASNPGGGYGEVSTYIEYCRTGKKDCDGYEEKEVNILQTYMLHIAKHSFFYNLWKGLGGE